MDDEGLPLNGKGRPQGLPFFFCAMHLHLFVIRYFIMVLTWKSIFVIIILINKRFIRQITYISNLRQLLGARSPQRPAYQDGKEARPNQGKPHDWTDANTDQKGGQMAGNQELSGFRLWWRKMRKWVFGVLAAAIMGVLLFYPGMAYIYERIGWRSPLLPRPGTEWLHEASYPGYLDIHLKVRWDTEDLSSYYRKASVFSPYPTTFQDIIAVQKKEDMNRNLGIPMSRSVALVVLEVIDYVDLFFAHRKHGKISV